MKTVTKLAGRMPALIPKKRVAAYARVSRASDEMAHSLSAQVSYYSQMIQSNPDWGFAGIFADYGISGTGTAKREEFNRMLMLARQGQIDLILTKSIQRFARNTLDLLEAVRELKEHGVEVWFEKENIHTLSSDGELMLTLLASFAQEESRSISENVKWGIRKRFEKGIPHNRSDVLGYRWVDGIPQIVPEQAPIIRRIFQNFLDGKSRIQTAKELNEAGITTRLGNEWDEMAIRDILTNPIYCGRLLLQRTYRSDHLTHRKIRNKGEVQQYLVDENHEPIIDPDVFDNVQQEMERRKEKGFFCQNPSPYTHKIWCANCGRAFQHDTRHDSWICRTKGCSNHSISTKAIQEMALDGFEKIVVRSDFTADVYHESGTVETHTWKQTGKKDCWTEERRQEQSKSIFARIRKGQGRYSEFSSRIFNAQTGAPLKRTLRPCKAEPSGKRAYWSQNGISIKEEHLKEQLAELLNLESYDPKQIIERVDRIELSKEAIIIRLMGGEQICQER